MNQNRRHQFLAATLLLLSLSVARADLFDFLKKPTKTNATAGTTALLSGLSQDDIVKGLKEALAKGTEQAVANLGKEDGFLKNLDVKIPMPEQLATVEKALRRLKQDKLADEFVTTMNRAAEKAAPEAAAIFADAIKGMTMEDAKAILKGPDDAATQYFKKVSQLKLTEKFLPIVKDATEKTGVTFAYKRLTEHTGSSALGGLLGGGQNVDVDKYVTDKALDGLFKMVAAEEKTIRQNPVARTTDILKKVFGTPLK